MGKTDEIVARVQEARKAKAAVLAADAADRAATAAERQADTADAALHTAKWALRIAIASAIITPIISAAAIWVMHVDAR